MKFITENSHYIEELKKELPFLCSFTNKITCLASNQVIDQVLENLTVQFDDYRRPHVNSSIKNLENTIERLYDKYSKMTDDESKEFAHDLSWLLQRIGASDLSAEGVYFPFFCEEHRYSSSDIQKDIEKIRNLLVNAHDGYLISGSYNDKDKTITFFNKNLNNTFESYLGVFVHEFFHAVHHALLATSGNYELLNCYYHEVVLESLAKFFEVSYMKERGYSCSMDFMNHSPIFNPYSGAKYIFEQNDFCDVLSTSLINFEDALKKFVLDHYEVEIILLKKPTPIVWERTKKEITIKTCGSKTVEDYFNAHDNDYLISLFKVMIHELQNKVSDLYVDTVNGLEYITIKSPRVTQQRNGTFATVMLQTRNNRLVVETNKPTRTKITSPHQLVDPTHHIFDFQIDVANIHDIDEVVEIMNESFDKLK